MERKIFDENLDLNNLILPYEEFVPFYDLGGFKLNPENREAAIANALPILEKKYETLYATEFLMFSRDGNRSIFESKYFERRNDLTALLVAEALEDEGRFVDKILDLVWMILEESTWIVPAHIHPFAAPQAGLPVVYEGKRKFNDLFAASTGGCLAFAWYICHEKFDAISPVISKRILENLNDRIIDLFVEIPANRHWMNGWWVNNWCPWILSNILTATALTPTSHETRVAVVEGAIQGLEKFMSQIGEDGAYDEGATYWRVASGSVYNAALVIRDMSGGKIDIFADEKIRRMGEFYPNMYITGDRFLNFSDARAKDNIVKSWGYDWGRLSSSEIMTGFWAKRSKEPEFFCPTSGDTYYKFYYRLCGEILNGSGNFTPKTSLYYESLQLAVMREYSDADTGFYLAMLGKHNPHSHTHADLGTVFVFHDGEPIFIDAGTGRYTKRTFSAERPNLWWIRSDHHNLPTINGKMQEISIEHVAIDAVFNEKNKTFSLNLTRAYPSDTEIENYERTVALGDGCVTVNDSIISKIEGEVCFNLLCNTKPVLVEDGIFTVHGRRVEYDKSLSFSYDCPDMTMPETVDFVKEWDTEQLYRIKLKAALEAGKNCVFELKVSK
jgi:hypothetical protein